MEKITVPKILDIEELEFDGIILKDFWIFALKENEKGQLETIRQDVNNIKFKTHEEKFKDIPEEYGAKCDFNTMQLSIEQKKENTIIGFLYEYGKKVLAHEYLRTKTYIREKSDLISVPKLLLFKALNAQTIFKELKAGNGEKIVIDYMNMPYLIKNDIMHENGKGYDFNLYMEKITESILVLKSLLSRYSNKDYFSKEYNGKIDGIQYNEIPPYSNYLKKNQYKFMDFYRFVNGEEFITSLNFDKISEYINKGYLDKQTVLEYFNSGYIPKEKALNYLLDGVFEVDEVFNNILKNNDIEGILQKDENSFETRLLLYSVNKMSIEDLEQEAQKHYDNDEELLVKPETFQKLSKFYKSNINKISELLTHNILDFTQSMEFLDNLIAEKAITEADKKYLVELMSNFKTNELLNESESELQTFRHKMGPNVHSHGVTIDPELRKEYFKSIGDIKNIFVNGQVLIKDDSKEATKKNSLDGYQLIIIPDKKIAVLEKFYEVTRDKDGNIVYKKDKDGNLIAAIENATYIMPIGMAKDFAEKKNKQELRKSPYVVTVSHTMNWVENTEQAMRTVAERAGLQVEFEKENTEKWQQTIIDNYKMLKEKRDKNIDELL